MTGNYHLVGIAGAGMNPLAQVLLAEGCAVSGSDRDHDAGRDLDVIAKLRKAGARIVPQDGSGVTSDTSSVVVSTAIESDNRDILAAARLNAPVLKRAALLARLVENKSCIAITGTSGKTTVTGMTGWILEQLGADPVVVNGGALLDWRGADAIGNVRVRASGMLTPCKVWADMSTIGNVRARARGMAHETNPGAQAAPAETGELWVIEVDESDRSLLEFSPDWAVITNASKDHFGLDETVALFEQFSRRVKKGLVAPLFDPDFFLNFSPELSADGSAFIYRGVRFRLHIPGRHNAENAFCAVIFCERLGFGLDAISEALASFRGIHRRLETLGSRRGIKVIDDYAHNPAKIRAAWLAVAPFCRRLIAIWQPHGFRPLSVMMDDLAGLFGELARKTDRIYVLPVYDAGGTADRSARSESLVSKLLAENVAATHVDGRTELKRAIVDVAREGDVVLVMGARDPGLPILAREILNDLEAR